MRSVLDLLFNHQEAACGEVQILVDDAYFKGIEAVSATRSSPSFLRTTYWVKDKRLQATFGDSSIL